MWLTAAGLAVGVVMAIGIFLLIGVQGVSSFWPRQAELFTVEHDGQQSFLLGHIARERQRLTPSGRAIEEVQIFRANREFSGEPHVYVEHSALVARSKPLNALLIERLENGSVLFFPTRLETPEKSIDADDPNFERALSQVVGHAAQARHGLNQVEKSRVESISRKLESLKCKVHRGTLDPLAADQQVATLHAELDELKDHAEQVRSGLAAFTLHGITANHQAVAIPSDQILDTYWPNRADGLTRLSEMGRRAWNFLSQGPRAANTEGGVFPAIFGTVVMTLLMTLLVTPFGVMAAVYLHEYAKQGPAVRLVRISVNNLAGVPSIVFGVFGLAFFVYTVGDAVDRRFFAGDLPLPTFGTPGILWASLTLALLTLPVVIVATEEALAAVPRGAREAALACGASKWQTIRRIVLPASMPGVLTGVMLAIARGAGEVAPLMLVGVVKLAPALPVDGTFPFIHLERKLMHLGFHLYDLGFQSPDAESNRALVYATALLLIIMVVSLNLAAMWLRNRLRKRYSEVNF